MSIGNTRDYSFLDTKYIIPYTYFMLLYFYGKDCPHCENMNALVKRLEGEDFQFEWMEVFENKNNEALMVEYDKEQCGGVPFLYNTDTGKWLCGETPYLETRAWALGED